MAAWLMQRREAKRLQQLAAQRPGESLCSFTRAFAWRKIDTWIIRAVYEELQEYLQGAGGFPLRAQDHLLRDLGLDAEEVDLYVVEAIAKRTGRSLQHYERNPYFGKVEQVADLVLFFAAQPKA
ncbi:MAG: hypothetical protein ABWY06_12845 [Pseudomonas sp.]|uniref:hypothetical protein n=1 Tax=Pseudomonas sp. TaxID=306 RepID=UPI003397F47A